MVEHAFDADDRLAVIVACTTLGSPRGATEVDPLGPQGWSKVAVWLHAQGLQPGDLFDPAVQRDAGAALESKIAANLATLPERATVAALELEGLQSRGIWVLVRFDPDYPQRWREQLKGASPPVLFGAGPGRLLNRTGIAIVGSREIGEELQEVAQVLGSRIAQAGYVVVSGGARGSDRWGMNGALEREGEVIGLLSGDLDRLSRQADIRRYLEEGRLCLLSHVHPRTGFSAGNAMMRNKYIHALANATIVIATTEGKGGTWSGAMENLKSGWSTLLVWTGEGAPVANQALVEKGAYPFGQIPATGVELLELIEEAAGSAPVATKEPPPVQGALFEVD